VIRLQWNVTCTCLYFDSNAHAHWKSKPCFYVASPHKSHTYIYIHMHMYASMCVHATQYVLISYPTKIYYNDYYYKIVAMHSYTFENLLPYYLLLFSYSKIKINTNNIFIMILNIHIYPKYFIFSLF
jgi:hypothetical protein